LAAEYVRGSYGKEEETGISYTYIIVTNDVILSHITSDASFAS